MQWTPHNSRMKPDRKPALWSELVCYKKIIIVLFKISRLENSSMFCTIAKPLFVFQKLRSGTWAPQKSRHLFFQKIDFRPSMSTVYLYKKNTVDGLTVHQSQRNLGRPDNRRTRRRRLKMRPWVSWVSTMLESNFPPSHYYSARRVRLGVTGSCGAPSTKAISCLVMEQFSSDAITTS